MRYGELKRYKTDKISEDSYLFDILRQNSTLKTTKNGKNSFYADINFTEVLKQSERYIKGIGLADYSLLEKINIQKDYLGYINIHSDKEEDKRKLYIKSTAPAKAKGKKAFGLRIITHSLGSGRESMFTIPYKGKFDYKTRTSTKPPITLCGEVKEGYVIFCKKYDSRVAKNGIRYFTLLDYKILEKK